MTMQFLCGTCGLTEHSQGLSKGVSMIDWGSIISICVSTGGGIAVPQGHKSTGKYEEKGIITDGKNSNEGIITAALIKVLLRSVFVRIGF